MYTEIQRLEALKHSLEAARDTKHGALETLTGDCLKQFESHIKGLRAGLQIAINAVDDDIRMAQRWQAVTRSAA